MPPNNVIVVNLSQYLKPNVKYIIDFIFGVVVVVVIVVAFFL